MAELLLGKDVNADLNERILSRVEKLKEKAVIPQLAILRVGERPDDLSYEHSAEVRCEKLGVKICKSVLPADCSKEDVIDAIHKANEDSSIHGVLLFRPLPKGIDEEAVIRELDPAKDMDGITTASMAGVFSGNGLGYPPCTAQAVMEILRHYNIPLAGKKAVVVGRSMVIGKPVAMMPMQPKTMMQMAVRIKTRKARTRINLANRIMTIPIQKISLISNNLELTKRQMKRR
jgi:methylenetetrahydrofolate dehydrogenase (NADP+)/methenyltetrahydrofolate cyclohydrolase